MKSRLREELIDELELGFERGLLGRPKSLHEKLRDLRAPREQARGAQRDEGLAREAGNPARLPESGGQRQGEQKPREMGHDRIIRERRPGGLSQRGNGGWALGPCGRFV